jgi:hypothetical protein
MKTLKDLARLVKEREADLAPGSETSILGSFVNEFDHVSSILDDETKLDVNRDETESYEAYGAAYDRMEKLEADGVPYDNDMLW